MRVFLSLLLLTNVAMAEPLPIRKTGQCPSGYSQSGGYCVPMAGTTRDAIPKERRHNVNPAIIPVRVWRHLYIQGGSPQEAADQACPLS
jgi:hypothetical protein